MMMMIIDMEEMMKLDEQLEFSFEIESKSNRIHKSESARTRRKIKKEIMITRTENFFSRMRKKRRKNS